MHPIYHPLSRRLAGAFLIAAQLLACTGWHAEGVAPAPYIADRHPDQVRLLLSDGTKAELSHPAIIGDSVVGTSQRITKSTQPGGNPYKPPAPLASESARQAIALTEVQQVAVRKTSAGKTALFVGVLLAPVVAAVIAVATWDGPMGSWGN